LGRSGNKNLKPHTSKNLKILVLCPFPVAVAAGQRLKYEQYFIDWKSLGYHIEVSSFMDLRMWKVVYYRGFYFEKILGVLRGQLRRFRDLFRIADYDLIYVFMWVTPFGTSTFERVVRGLAKRLIYDVEDNVLVEQTITGRVSHPNRWVAFLKGPGKAQFLTRSADHVITSSPFLNELCLKMNMNKLSTYISSSVDTDRFRPANLYHDENVIVIGWTGTFSSKIYLDLLRSVFLKLADRVKFKLKIIGNFAYELPGIDLEVVQWSSQTEVEDLQTIDIGVYPLPIDDWVLGKSGLKAIQYMAFGLPIVATKVGTTSLLISDKVDGLLVESQEEWVDALERLVREPDLRRKLGEAARAKAVQKYSVSAVKLDYRRVLETVMKGTKV
jgi:glycosyltransferase involved in cell wall biosynthesis